MICIQRCETTLPNDYFISRIGDLAPTDSVVNAQCVSLVKGHAVCLPTINVSVVTV